MEATCAIIDSQALTATTHVIRTTRPANFDFQAGQHVLLELETATGPDDRFLSIASAPHDAHLEFAVRLSDSDFKQAFKRLQTGDQIQIVGPSGKFKRDPSKPAILISGGIGITPLRSMLLDAKCRNLPPTVLIYGNRTPDDIPYQAELIENVEHTVDQPDATWRGHVGHIDAELIERVARSLESPNYYLCGPPGMVRAITETLRQMGVENLFTENFNGY